MLRCLDLNGVYTDSRVVCLLFMHTGRRHPEGKQNMWRIAVGLLLVVHLLNGCADEYIVFHSKTGEPLLLSKRSYTSDGCIGEVREEAARLGLPLRYMHIRGSWAGRSLLWPFEPGYACEAAFGPEQLPSGTYNPSGTQILLRGS